MANPARPGAPGPAPAGWWWLAGGQVVGGPGTRHAPAPPACARHGASSTRRRFWGPHLGEELAPDAFLVGLVVARAQRLEDVVVTGTSRRARGRARQAVTTVGISRWRGQSVPRSAAGQVAAIDWLVDCCAPGRESRSVVVLPSPPAAPCTTPVAPVRSGPRGKPLPQGKKNREEKKER